MRLHTVPAPGERVDGRNVGEEVRATEGKNVPLQSCTHLPVSCFFPQSDVLFATLLAVPFVVPFVALAMVEASAGSSTPSSQPADVGSTIVNGDSVPNQRLYGSIVGADVGGVGGLVGASVGGIVGGVGGGVVGSLVGILVGSCVGDAVTDSAGSVASVAESGSTAPLTVLMAASIIAAPPASKKNTGRLRLHSAILCSLHRWTESWQ